MNRNFTHSLSYCVLTLILLAFTTNTKSQTSLQFSNPSLVSGTDGQVGATYKFPDATSGVDAYITIENIVGGAILKNIDNTSVGYNKAWQPTVGGPGTYGSSYIKWSVQFKDKSGNPQKMGEVDATGIDIDGDGGSVREFTMANGQSSYTTPSQIPTALVISNDADTDNVNGTDASSTNLKALGPVANRIDIDTLSEDVRIDYVFLNTTGFKFYTGAEVDSNGYTGGRSTDRYHSIYFDKISGLFNVLPITYQNLNAVANNNAINLNWQSDADTKKGYFEIEKGFSNNSFNTIAIMMGALSQNSAGIGQYNYIDNSSDNASHNTIYYRLKIVDATGNISYSQVITVKFNNATIANTTVKVFPNPYIEKVNISFDSKEAGIAQVSLSNASGNVVKMLHQQIVEGTNNLSMTDLSQQSAGVYFLNVTVNGKIVESKKIMKL